MSIRLQSYNKNCTYANFIAIFFIASYVFPQVPSCPSPMYHLNVPPYLFNHLNQFGGIATDDGIGWYIFRDHSYHVGKFSQILSPLIHFSTFALLVRTSWP